MADFFKKERSLANSQIYGASFPIAAAWPCHDLRISNECCYFVVSVFLPLSLSVMETVEGADVWNLWPSCQRKGFHTGQHSVLLLQYHILFHFLPVTWHSLCQLIPFSPYINFCTSFILI